VSTAESAYSLLITAGLLLNGLAVAGGTPVRALLAPLRDRGLLLGAVAVDLVVVPAALLLPTLVLDLRPGETAGLVLLAAASTGPIGIALTRIGRGDVPATVAIVTALGTANLVTVPALLAVLLPEAAGVPALEVGRTLLLLLVAPLGAGAVLRHLLGRRRWHPEAVARLARRLGAASTACIGAAVTVGLAIDPRGIVGELLGPPLVPALLMIAVAWVAAVLLTTDGPRRRSLWLASTARSVGVALAVAAIHLPGSAETRAAVLAVGGLTQALPILLLLGRDRWARPAGAPRRGVTPGRDAGA
jgi:predicted Na+-dependent transporter